MLQNILLLIPTILLSISLQAQDVQVDVQHFLYDQNGQFVSGGRVVFTLEEDVLPIDVTLHPFPPCGDGYSETALGISYIFNAGIPCSDAQEYCFTLVTNFGTDDACSIDLCVTMLLCKIEQIGNFAVRTCPNITKPAPELPTFSQSNPNTQILEEVEAQTTLKTAKTGTENDAESNVVNVEEFILNKAYPNPFKNEISVELFSGQVEKTTMRLLDLMGKEVHQEEVQLQQGNNQLTLTPQQNLPSGTYLLHIYRHDGHLITTKLIKGK